MQQKCVPSNLQGQLKILWGGGISAENYSLQVGKLAKRWKIWQVCAEYVLKPCGRWTYTRVRERQKPSVTECGEQWEYKIRNMDTDCILIIFILIWILLCSMHHTKYFTYINHLIFLLNVKVYVIEEKIEVYISHFCFTVEKFDIELSKLWKMVRSSAHQCHGVS